jgi:hypothetical protein
MTADLLISYNVNRLSTVSMRDNSVYDLTTTIQDINGTRFRFATATSLAAPSQNVTIAQAFFEYIVVSGTFTYNGTAYVAGDVFCFVSTFPLPNTCIVAATGYYVPVSTYLPTDATPASFTPTQTGLGGNVIYFPDTSFVVDYELYSTKYAQNATLPAGRYLVIGGGTILFNGVSTFSTGELLTAVGGETFTDTTGQNYVVKYETNTPMYFYTNYYSFALWERYTNYIATSYQVSQQTYSDFLQITSKLNACNMYAQQNFGVSLNGIQELLDQVNNNFNPLR